jgi:hemoglobin
LCQVTGGPCVYKGRGMKTAHKGLGITQADWDNQ